MIDWLERKIGWIAFPFIIRYLAFFQLGVLGLTFINPTANQLLAFNWEAILKGEVWRLFTFIFSVAGSLAGSNGGTTAFFAIFGALLMLSFSDGLEQRWGSFRTTLFFISGMIVSMMASIIFSILPIGIFLTESGSRITVVDSLPPAIIFNATILFAFATYYPRYRILLFFIIPVPIFILASLSGAYFLLHALSGVAMFFYLAISLSHYLIVAIPLLISIITRKKKVTSYVKKTKSKECFHTCEECGKRDIDDPEATFRITSDGRELCNSCLESKKG